MRKGSARWQFSIMLKALLKDEVKAMIPFSPSLPQYGMNVHIILGNLNRLKVVLLKCRDLAMLVCNQWGIFISIAQNLSFWPQKNICTFNRGE